MMDQTRLKEAAARIPAEYQEVFQEAIQRELRDAGRTETDSDTLAYLRQRLEQFESGDYIRPDGKAGTVTVPPDQVYDLAGEKIAEQGTATTQGPFWRRIGSEAGLKIAGLVLVFVIFVVFAVRNQMQRTAHTTTPAPTVEAADGASQNAGLTPAPTILAPTGSEAALQTIGGLGGSLTLGRPSALAIRYQSTEETVALPIDPARISNRGELPFNAGVMASDSPVAVWVFGTVLNYALGLPSGLVQALQPGDRLQLSTDTGFSLSFVVTETGTRAGHETGALLSQDWVGMTLFGLPAPAADSVPVAIASYDLTAEDALTAVYKEMGQPLFSGSPLQITDVTFSDHSDGGLDVTLTGIGQEGNGVLAIHGRSHQTTAVALPAADPWQLRFTLPATMVGESLTAVFRRLPSGASAAVRLGEAPDLSTTLIVVPPEAMWQAATGEMVVVTEVTNPGPGQTCLPPDYLQIPVTGDDTPQTLFTPVQCLTPGETRTLRLAVTHPGPETPLVVQVGSDLWGTP